MRAIESNRTVVTGIDGSGKSTAALEAAGLLSEAYKTSTIKVVDSSGIHHFANGELAKSRWDINGLIPKAEHSKLRSVVQLGAFTMARRQLEGWVLGDGSDLIISVRDPFRIDPAVYSSVYGPAFMQNLDTLARLRLFHNLTVARHPSEIIHLVTDERVKQNVNTTNPDFHETPERIEQSAGELPKVIEAYKQLFGAKVSDVPALSPQTADLVAGRLEPILANTFNTNDAKNLRVNYL